MSIQLGKGAGIRVFFIEINNLSGFFKLLNLSILNFNCNYYCIIVIVIPSNLKIIKHILLFQLFLTSVICGAQELPPILNFTPKEYGAENQNWSISQSSEKHIYVANNSGLLEYDGATWKLYPSPNNAALRYVNVIEEKIYTGGYKEFGFWIKNEFGKLVYESLSNKIKDDLLEEDFWKIIKFDSFMLFQSLKRLYIYDTQKESFEIITSKASLPKLLKVDGDIYFQKIGEGIFKIENGQPVLVLDNPIVKDNILVNIFKIKEELLFQTQEVGIHKFINGKLLPWEVASNKIISKLSIYSSIQLKDESIVLGTISNGIYHLDIDGTIISAINQESGLNNNTILSMYEDADDNLWLGLDNGISVVNVKSPISVYQDLKGELGAVYASVIFENKLYLGTNQGLFFKNINSNARLKFIEGTKGQVWSLKVIDDTLFCGHNSGTFIVVDNEVDLIADVMGTWDVKPINDDKTLLLQGNYSGLYMLEKKKGKWQLRNKIQGFDISSRYFEINGKNQLFVSNEIRGVFKLKIADDLSEVLEYTTEKSVPKGLKSSLINYKNSVIYCCKEGVFKYNNQQDAFLKDELLSVSLLADDNYVSGNLIADNERNMLWSFTGKNIVYFSSGKLNKELRATKIGLPATLRRDIPGFESISHIKEQLYLFGTTKGYILLDLNKLIKKNFTIAINSIENSVIDKEKIQASLKNSTEFKSFENNLYFEFSVPEFNKFFEVNYQYKLDGFYSEWSNWSTKQQVHFENLPFGDYTFKVKAQIGNTSSVNMAIYEFSIERPWYISNLMIVVYVVFLILLGTLTHFLYRRNFNRQKQKLLDKKQREFAVDKLESEKVIMKLRNDKLRAEIESKTRELSTSTMSIIKKNEILNTIKSELTDVKDDRKVKTVIKTINKNLTNTGDWQMFQEAFNNADSDFLKKVKSQHPTLTPNDLRLCAYLRLNLASKEIAPLLNISVRSVEIKRYRLRKKMELLHEKSLVEYILEI